jgi:hypothetical protein
MSKYDVSFVENVFAPSPRQLTERSLIFGAASKALVPPGGLSLQYAKFQFGQFGAQIIPTSGGTTSSVTKSIQANVSQWILRHRDGH